MNYKKIFIIFFIFITINIIIRFVVNICKASYKTKICIGKTCLEKEDLDRLLLQMKNNYSEKYEDPTPTPTPNPNQMLCISSTCLDENDFIRIKLKLTETPTVIYSKTPLVRDTSGKDLSTPADIKRMLPNGGVIYSEENGPITFKINSENERYYTYTDKYQLWQSVYITSLDLVYQSQDTSIGNPLYKLYDTGNEMGNYKGLRYMETNDKWLDLDAIGLVDYLRSKAYKNQPLLLDASSIQSISNKYYRPFYILASIENESIKLSTTIGCGPSFGKCKNSNQCCGANGICYSNCSISSQVLPMFNNKNVELSTSTMITRYIDGVPQYITRCGPEVGRCPNIGECCSDDGYCYTDTTKCGKGITPPYYSNPPKDNLYVTVQGTTNYKALMYISTLNRMIYEGKEKFCLNLLIYKPSTIRTLLNDNNINRIFGFSDDFDYYINGEKYTTPSTNLWIAFKTLDGNIYEGLYVPKNRIYSSNDLNDPLSLISFVRRKADLINDTWIYENIPSLYNNNFTVIENTNNMYQILPPQSTEFAVIK